MADEKSHIVQASDLPIALYLNQRVTFDLLAALEDGFAHITTVQEASSETQQSGVRGGLGVSNPFAFLGLSFGAKGHRESASASSGTTTQDLVHTPTSLFAQLRKELIRLELVKYLHDGQDDLEGIEPGDFVEVRAVLRRSPLIVVLNTIRELAPMMEAFESAAAGRPSEGSRRRKGKSNQRSKTSQVVHQLDTLIQSITAPGSEDLIAEFDDRRFVLTTEPAYFVDPTMNDVIDGTFRILGKVARVVPAEAKEGISLLRKSPLGNLGGMVDQLGSAFKEFPQDVFTEQRIETEIPGPTLQLIPIAIFA